MEFAPPRCPHAPHLRPFGRHRRSNGGLIVHLKRLVVAVNQLQGVAKFDPRWRALVAKLSGQRRNVMLRPIHATDRRRKPNREPSGLDGLGNLNEVTFHENERFFCLSVRR